MALHFNVSEIVPGSIAKGVERRSLLSRQTVPDIKLTLDCVALSAQAELALSVSAHDLAWFQVLEGELMLTHAAGDARLTDAHVVFLPPAFSGTLRATSRASLLLAVVPDAAQLDPEFAAKPPGFRSVDWKNEPLLESKHDARKRIYLATPALFGTKAIKGEMIIYPPRTEAPRHHHVGAAHFMYFLRGCGTAFAGERSFQVKQGDLVYYSDQEEHALRGGEGEDMIFSEFFVPAGATTVWVHPEKACTWVPTGKNIKGGTPSRDIQEHSFANPASATGV